MSASPPSSSSGAGNQPAPPVTSQAGMSFAIFTELKDFILLIRNKILKIPSIFCCFLPLIHKMIHVNIKVTSMWTETKSTSGSSSCPTQRPVSRPSWSFPRRERLYLTWHPCSGILSAQWPLYCRSA